MFSSMFLLIIGNVNLCKFHPNYKISKVNDITIIVSLLENIQISFDQRFSRGFSFN